MSEQQPRTVCHQCGADIFQAAPEGLCPKCLVGMGLSLISTQSGRQREEKSAEPPPSASQPRRFGDYELLDEIARGGMGVVYRARQISLNRVVAVKVLLFGQFASDAFVKRFRAEAEAAASLNHPNIVAIHEVGEQDGQHYFSMDLIEGQSLAELTRDGPLPAHRAAKLLATIATAIHYAHTQGVIHRDLKPSNVLIDRDGEPHVTDFGLAKRLAGDGELTTTGQMLGSPNFMPPEQADPTLGQTGPLGDIYSLGALLYHLLTGRPPFAGESVEATLRQLLQQESVAPRLLNPGVPVDLETICLKCLAKEPPRRYASARMLAEEFGRFLRDEPILSRPVGLREKFQRWCRREPALAGLSLGLGVVLFTGLIISAGLLWRERSARLRASAAEQAESRLRIQMEAQKNVATSEAAKSRQLADFLQQMLTRAGPSASLGRDTTLLREILDQTAQRIDTAMTNQPVAVAELRDTIGRTYYDIGDYPKAIAMHREALRLRGELGESVAAGGVQSMHLLAQALAENGDLDEAESLNLRALELWKQLLGANDPKVAGSLNNLGNVYFRRTNLTLAKENFEEALSIYRLSNHPNTSVPVHNLANVLAMQNDFAGAERLYREAVALARQQHGDSHPTTALYLRNLGDVLRAQGKLKEAAAAHGEALATRASLLDELHPLLADSFERLAVVKSQQQQWDEAEILYRKALAARRKQAPDDPAVWSEDANMLADILKLKNRFDEAERLLTELIAAANDKNPRTVRLYSIRANSRGRNGRWQEAASDLAQARTRAPEDHWHSFLLAIALLAIPDEAAFRTVCRDSFKRFAETSDPDTAYRLALMNLLSPVASGDHETIHALLDRALAESARSGGSDYGVVIKALAEYRSHRPAEAVARIDALLQDVPSGKLQGRYLQIQANAVLAMAHHALGHAGEARAALHRARTIAPVKIEVPPDGDYSVRWHEWLMLKYFLREASELIEGAK